MIKPHVFPNAGEGKLCDKFNVITSQRCTVPAVTVLVLTPGFAPHGLRVTHTVEAKNPVCTS